MKEPADKHALNGAMTAGLIAIGLPLLLLKYSTSHYDGGGANIGLGLLITAMPVYVPLAIWFGWKMGKNRTGNSSPFFFPICCAFAPLPRYESPDS